MLNAKNAKRAVISVVGFTVLLLGCVMIVFPGPAILFIPLGLAILATEFVWARKVLHKFKRRMPKGARRHFARFWKR